MKKITHTPLLAMGFVAALVSASACASSWQDKLSSTASDLMNSSSATSGQASGAQNGLSLSSITGLLNGGNKAVSSDSMSNATGILQYCAENNLVKNNVSSVTDQLKNKLGLTDSGAQQQESGYMQGLAGLLNTGNNQQISLKSLSNTPLGEKLKTKACNVVLEQGKKYLGM
ncbi:MULTISPECIES: DUF2501 domain-containing protein [Tatumella]|uniref:DUF2501 domain-containing protein n=1 Tax=Tatumella punctata TaxID=399969 RepID=A0ABW1VPY0_9GAMM|nr:MULTISPECIES: DUF2501 domain-containing protein [unclassified Tatumella]MBS0857203.1 DUF2501 domain-containing protein [Tatumella sp. JGM16]MBS0895491.1 DUF2501 domain-containing protein [Tatumella sp. JGM130]MBS0913947.1 DUF2501 domain-containing protein [Tatumella sp. JGM91]